jgi:TDG/mug DNA glycosylase family protein
MIRKAAGPESGPAEAPDVLPDVLAPGLTVVFCGSAPGTYSARAGAYYAKPGNAFWPTLHRVGLTPRLLKPQEFTEVMRFGIGLTDLGKHAFGADHELPPGAYDVARLRRTVLYFRPRLLAFAAKAPARAFLGRAVATGPQPEQIGETEIWVLSSPSGRARRFWDEAAWQMLADRVLRLREPRTL